MGALYNWVNLQQDYDCYFFIADLHALTTDYADPSLLKQNVFDIALDFLAAGLNPGKCTMFIQSHVPQHAELHLLFSMFTPLGWLERVPTYKDQQEQLREKDLSTYGFLGYPLLQSADILLYRPQFVPVGADQVAHVELTREVARKFNYLYSPKRIIPRPEGASANQQAQTEPDPDQLILSEPEVLLTPSPKLPGIDGRKMSKSYGNAIYLTDARDVVQRKMHSMTNGGQRPTQADPGNPDSCPVADLHRVFSGPEMNSQIRNGCITATIRCDECKFMAALSITEKLVPIQIRRRELEAKASTVWEALQNGSQRAQQAAEAVMKDVRAATGLSRDLSGIRADASLPAGLKTKDIRDLSHLDAWWNSEPAVLTRNLRKVWREDIAGSQVALKPDTETVWITRNNRRVYIAAAIEEQDASGRSVWKFSSKPKSYEVIVLLCWDKHHILHDFIIPQQLFSGQWREAKQNAGKANIEFEVMNDKGKYLMVIPQVPAVDITDLNITATESDYPVIGD